MKSRVAGMSKPSGSPAPLPWVRAADRRNEPINDERAVIMTEQPSLAPDLTKLLAFDAEDLEVVSAKFQDAIVRVGDMAYLPKEKRFALVGARFDWIGALQGRRERCWSGLHFERVERVAHMAIPQDQPKAMLSLLAIGFEPTETPSGRIVLTFSGGGAIKLDVECVEAQMRDTTCRWRTRSLPGHPLSDVEQDIAAACAEGQNEAGRQAGPG